MSPRPPRRPGARLAALAALAALTLTGCGEVTNTITAPPGTADTISVVLAGPPNAFDAGLYEAQALGLFAQSDLQVRLVTPAAGADPLTLLHDGAALVALSSEPNVLLHRNLAQPVVGVGAIVHVPLQTIAIPLPKGGPSGGAPLGTTTPARRHRRRPAKPVPTTTRVPDPAAALWPAQLQQLLATPGYPTYDGLVLVVRKETIVYRAPLLRRFVQALARGYRAARAHPGQAIAALITAVPALAPQRALETAMLRAALPEMFPAGVSPWGLEPAAQWNAFGSWLNQHRLLSNPNAITDASTNELLAGQGV